MITAFTGSNSFLLKTELDKLVNAFVVEHGDFGLEKIDGEEVEYNRMVEALQNLPFLASRKLVVLRNPGSNKEFAEKFEALIDTIPETNDIIIYESRLDKRTAYAKLLKKKTDYKTYDEPDERELPKWLTGEAKNRGGLLSIGDANYLVNRVGAGQQLLSNELDKLLAYNVSITKETIDLLSDETPKGTIFQLLDAAFSGNTKRALELYQEQRAQRIEPQAITPMIIWQLQAITIVKTAGQRSIDEIASDSKINPFVLRKSAVAAKKLSLSRLKELIHELRLLDVALKSTDIDADEALKLYIMQLANSRQ